MNIARNVPGLADCMRAVGTNSIEKVLGVTIITGGTDVADAFRLAGLVESRGQFKQLFASKSRLEVNGHHVEGPTEKLSEFPSDDEDRWVLHRGVNRVRIVKVQ